MLLLVRIQQWRQKFLKTEPRFAQLLANLHEQIKGYSISLELVSSSQYIYFYFHIPEKLRELIVGQVYALYPDAVVEEKKEDYVTDLKMDDGIFIVSQMKSKRSNLYPWKRYDEFEGDSLAGLFTVLSKAGEGEQLWVQIVISPRLDDYWFNAERSLKQTLNSSARWFRWRDKLKSKAQKDFFEQEKTAISTKAEERQYKVNIKLAVYSKDKQSADRQLIALQQAFTQFNSIDFNGFSSGHRMRGNTALAIWKERSLRGSLLMGINELAGMYYFPDPQIVPHIVHVLARRSEPPLDLPKAAQKDVVSFGMTNYHNQQIPFGILREDRARHMYVVGKSGNGKSKFLELLISKDIKDGQGVCVMDPHGDLVDAVLNHIPEERVKDVIYFNPMDTQHPIAFNPLEAVSPELKLRVTIGFIEIFKKLFGANWTPRLEHMLRQTTLALLDSEGTTVFSILKMLSDKNYRQRIVANIEDAVVKNFWVNEFAAWSEKFDHEAIMPLLNKVGQLVSTDLIRNIIGQPKNTFNIREVMDEQKILLVKLNKGLLGEENAALLGAMMITKIEQAALERADMPEEERKPFYLYCDEFQYFATDTFTEILSEARKYKLSVTVAHQYMGQLIPTIRSTIFGNVGTIVSFRVGADDAAMLEREFVPVFQGQDIINLAVREFYIKMSVNGQTHNAFSANTMDIFAPKENFKDEIVEYSRLKYTSSKEKVQEVLKRWDEGSNYEDDSIKESKVLNQAFIQPIIVR